MSDRAPRLEDFSAPYHFFAEKLYVVYRTSRARLAAALPSPFVPRAVAGQYVFVFEVAHFFHVEGSGHSPPITSYNEIIHWTCATVGQRPTFHLWKLYLDDPLPILLGRELYGFPKHPARLRYQKDPDRLLVEVEPETGPPARLVVDRRSWLSRLPMSDLLVNRFAREVVTGAELMFVHPRADQLTVSRLFDARVEGARAVRVVDARLPLFEELGLLRPGAAPLLALHLPSFRISLGAPTREPLSAQAVAESSARRSTGT